MRFCNTMAQMTAEIKNEPVQPTGRFGRFLKSFWGETLQIIIVSLVIVIPFRLYIAQPFVVSGPSMDNTFADGQYLIVDELTYELRNPQRGEVVIFHYPLDTTKYLAKFGSLYVHWYMPSSQSRKIKRGSRKVNACSLLKK